MYSLTPRISVYSPPSVSVLPKGKALSHLDKPDLADNSPSLHLSAYSLQDLHNSSNLGGLERVNMKDDRDTSSSSPDSMATSHGNPKNKPGNRVLGRLFTLAKSNKWSAQEAEYVKTELRSAIHDMPYSASRMPPLSPDLIITPNPSIRPIGQKLVARVEPTNLKFPSVHARMKPGDGLNYMPFQMAGQSQEAFISTSGSISKPEEQQYSRPKFDLSKREGQILMLPHCQRFSLTIQNQTEVISEAWSAGDDKARAWWLWYIENYVNGKLSCTDLSLLPNQNLESGLYFPAFFPPWEQSVVSYTQELESLWPHWSSKFRKPIEDLMIDASQTFGTPFVALSFFDGEFEILKAENGYNVKYIERDTFMFKDHPLVVTKPRIRFFAGAPLLSSDGVPVGVFSIWSKKPRQLFDGNSKAHLMEYAAAATKEIRAQVETLTCTVPNGEEHRATPLLERDSMINGDYRRSRSLVHSPNNDVADSYQPELEVPALRFYKERTRTLPASDRVSKMQPSHSLLCEQTPPSSAESEREPSFSNLQSDFGKNFKQLIVKPGIDTFPQLQDLITPVSDGFDIPEAGQYDTSRPFSSGSDLTSVHRMPNNTPLNHVDGGEVAEFLLLSDRDVFEDTGYLEEDKDRADDPGDDIREHISGGVQQSTISESQSFSDNLKFSASPDLRLTTHSLAIVPMRASNSLIDMRNASRQGRSHPEQPTRSPLHNRFSGGSQVALARHSAVENWSSDRSSTISFNVSATSTRSSQNPMNCLVSRADFNLKESAQRLGFDLMYAVELIPEFPDMTDEQLYAEGGVKFNLLACYGDLEGNPMSFGSTEYINALRSQGWKRYRDQASQSAGLLLSFSSQDIPPQQRTSGIVFAAFRKNGPPVESKRELRKVQKAMASLLVVMFGCKPKPKPKPKQGSTDPVQLSPFPANEARELGAHIDGYATVIGRQRRSIEEQKQTSRRRPRTVSQDMCQVTEMFQGQWFADPGIQLRNTASDKYPKLPHIPFYERRV
ncbi:hypothetical protein B0O99DRAFT_597596 [Bisporella sp. PMI_857]|nr:hypothetical protein B0O99DRAFT_597596 [Bisporella sp. PMI_857]